MAATDKDTIYIDIDDEITSIIDKLRNSEGKITALVLPKRATVFQSIVNMRLLKRAADDAKKHLVLITSEAGLMPLAGAAGVHVAKTLNSKPEIPADPSRPETEDAIGEDGEELVDLTGESDEAPIAPTKPTDDVETVSLDDDDEADAPKEKPTAAAAVAAGAAAKGAGKAKKPKKDKKLAIPNFEKFRLLLILGGVLLLFLIGGGVYAFTAMPKATISVKTDATSVPTDLTLNLSTAATSVRESNNTLPAKLATQQKTYTGQVTTTGQKNNGNKASGSITMTAKICNTTNDPPTIAAGTGVSSSGQTFITQNATSFSDQPDRRSGGCLFYRALTDTRILAQAPGTAYNNATSFTVAGHKDDISAATPGSITGGTDNIVQVANQEDIANAKAKLNAGTDSTARQALQSQLKGDGYVAITATYNAGSPTVTTSVNAGDPATTVTATQTISSTMFGVRQNDLKTLVENDIKKQINASKQSILDNGIDKANYIIDSSSATGAQVGFSATATAGPDLDIDSIKQDAAGKKPAEIRSQLGSNPDVTDVDVKLSPFFVSSVPTKLEKITVTIAKPSSTKPANNDGN